MPVFNVYPISEGAITIEFGAEISGTMLQQVTTFNRHLNNNPFPGFYASVPGYATLSIFYDVMQVREKDTLRGDTCFEKVANYITQLNNQVQPDTEADCTEEIITIPVCYDSAYAPDIQEVINHTGLSGPEVVQQHTSAVYLVHMIGFIPGFAYMGGMPPQLATPRKKKPSKDVLPGAVGIAGVQTGIYPLQTPGGWQVIGRTPLMMFDKARAVPSLLKAGNKVVFKSISNKEFEEYNSR